MQNLTKCLSNSRVKKPRRFTSIPSLICDEVSLLLNELNIPQKYVCRRDLEAEILAYLQEQKPKEEPNPNEVNSNLKSIEKNFACIEQRLKEFEDITTEIMEIQRKMPKPQPIQLNLKLNTVEIKQKIFEQYVNKVQEIEAISLKTARANQKKKQTNESVTANLNKLQKAANNSNKPTKQCQQEKCKDMKSNSIMAATNDDLAKSDLKNDGKISIP